MIPMAKVHVAKISVALQDIPRAAIRKFYRRYRYDLPFDHEKFYRLDLASNTKYIQ